jgi:hypothetical protein
LTPRCLGAEVSLRGAAAGKRWEKQTAVQRVLVRLGAQDI